ncbi:DUF3891 family protein [Paenibacillus arenilitoris]|uniref:DUF3891 family protein n=1 Tax=Paenibacillus arenilitoris TaxID=2772299 RepID=A0A927CIV7_9BACL|nr:DUF3891 family protein [Paenibacillus arenilitoris]MBD2867443.1 DUF3891 family protein [Paenibacillus arenilitoris]
MIVYEKDDAYVLIAQHDHARISGDLASAWRGELFGGEALRDEMTRAAYEHDASWLELDRVPLWNDAAGSPYTFRDYPGNIRFVFYERALDDLQRSSEYAALLGSILYTTLAERIRNEDTVPFVEREFARQSAIIEKLGVDVKLLQTHAKALLLCDELSLFACMEAPGTNRSRYEWFAGGFAYWFGPPGQTTLAADWTDEHTIALAPYPLMREVETSIVYREVSKADVAKWGISEAYRRATPRKHGLLFRQAR